MMVVLKGSCVEEPKSDGGVERQLCSAEGKTKAHRRCSQETAPSENAMWKDSCKPLRSCQLRPAASSPVQATSQAMIEVLGPSTRPKTEEEEEGEKEEEEEEAVKRGWKKEEEMKRRQKKEEER